jgi:hypothetical protein
MGARAMDRDLNGDEYPDDDISGEVDDLAGISREVEPAEEPQGGEGDEQDQPELGEAVGEKSCRGREAR